MKRSGAVASASRCGQTVLFLVDVFLPRSQRPSSRRGFAQPLLRGVPLNGPHLQWSRSLNILVTGCAGFIGSNVCQQLLDAGDTVFGIDSLNGAYDPRLKQRRVECLEPAAGFTWQQADVTDRARLTELFAEHEFDCVVNLAARAGVRESAADPWGYFETNVTGTLNLLELCRVSSTRRFILASSSSVYGDAPVPFVEDAKADRPLSPYAASKKAAEVLCHSYFHNYGIGTTALRFFTVFGPAGRPDMSMFRFVRWIREGDEVQVFGDGRQRRDFTFIDDVARGVVEATRRDLGYEIINLGSDRPVELMSVIAAIEKRAGKKAQIVHTAPNPADSKTTHADVSKAKRLLGWEAQVKVEDGVDRTVDWYLENRSWARELSI